VLWGTRRLLARRVPPILRPCSDIIRNCKDLLGLFIEERAIITKVRLLHLSVQTLRPQTRTASIATRPNGADMRQLTASRGGLSCVNFVKFQAACLFASPSVSRNSGDISFFFC